MVACWPGRVLHGHVAESAAPFDQMRKAGTIQRDFIGILHHVAVLLQSEGLGGMSAAVGVFEADGQFRSR